MTESDINESLKRLLRCKKGEKFLLNGKYECAIKNSKPFLTFIRDDNCANYSSYALVKVAGTDKLSKVQISWNTDLAIGLQCCLCFYDNDNITSSFSITDIQFI